MTQSRKGDGRGVGHSCESRFGGTDRDTAGMHCRVHGWCAPGMFSSGRAAIDKALGTWTSSNCASLPRPLLGDVLLLVKLRFTSLA